MRLAGSKHVVWACTYTVVGAAAAAGEAAAVAVVFLAARLFNDGMDWVAGDNCLLNVATV